MKKEPVDVVLFLCFMCLVFFLTGTGLLCYCLLYGYNPWGVSVLSSPFHYFAVGWILMGGLLLLKYK